MSRPESGSARETLMRKVMEHVHIDKFPGKPKE